MLKTDSSNQHFHQLLVSNELGGAGSIGLQLAMALREKRQQSYVWIPGDGPATAKAEELGITCREYDPTKALTASMIQGALSNWKIGRLLRPHRPGLIHVHSPFYYRALLLGLKISNLKTIVHVHLQEENAGLRWSFKRPPDVIITCARFLREHVRAVLPEGYQDTQNIVAVPNAVDTERFHRGDKIWAKLQVGAPPQTRLVLMVANLALHKGQETALRAAAILRKKGMAAQFWFAGVERGGSTEYTSRLRSLVTELSLTDHVQFLGQRKDIPELLRAADCFILPSTSEGLPLSILEAQASGTPVLAAPTAGIPEVVIDGRTGFLVAAVDADGYAHRLFYLLRNPTQYSQIADRAYANVMRDHSWKTYIERVWEIYQSLLYSRADGESSIRSRASSLLYLK